MRHAGTPAKLLHHTHMSHHHTHMSHHHTHTVNGGGIIGHAGTAAKLLAVYVYPLYVSLICMPYMYALYVCLICMPYMYALCVWQSTVRASFGMPVLQASYWQWYLVALYAPTHGIWVPLVFETLRFVIVRYVTSSYTYVTSSGCPLSLRRSALLLSGSAIYYRMCSLLAVECVLFLL